MTTIYVILEDDQIRCIGKTKKSDLKEKLAQHMIEAKSNPKKYLWLENCSKSGKKPEIRPVFTYQDHEADHYEKLFISDYKYFSTIRQYNSN